MRQAMRAVLFLMAGAAAVMVSDRLAGATHGDAAPTSGLELCATADGQVMLAGPSGCGAGTTSAGVVAHQQSAKDAFAHIAALESRVAALKDDNAALASRMSTLESDNAALASRMSTLESDNTSLKSRVSTLESDNTSLKSRVSTLESKLVGVTRTGSVLRFSGMNLQVVNGTGTTWSSNGTGNIIIGYNRERHAGPVARTGSHYLVVGDDHGWTSYAGIVAGFSNTASRNEASVIGGVLNTASGERSFVGGGAENTASGHGASVTGGYQNTASGRFASVSGGENNTASGVMASVSGGYLNTASGRASSVSGGSRNTAAADWSSVSGGYERTSSGFLHWRAGSLFQDR